MKSIQITEISIEELTDLIRSENLKLCKSFQEMLGTQKANDDLLTRDETCEFLKIDSSTLWHWSKKGKVKAYKIVNRVYYKRSELLESLQIVVR